LEAQPTVDYAAISPEELVVACLQSGNESAWAEFVRRFHPLIARVALRVARQWGDPSPQVIDDLVQETYLKLCGDRFRVLRNFKSAHKDATYGYIKVFTANLVHDHFKVGHSQKRGGRATETSIDGPDSGRVPQAATSAPAMLERDVLIQQIDACLQLVASGPGSERDRRIFLLYYRVGLAASAIAALPAIGLSTKGVESTLLRLTRAVRQRLVTHKQQSPQQESSGKGIRPAEAL
jgi:RNA polymerase sigma-70 factor (ECF subfamily)